MSYCRWSSDDFQCDLYCYESTDGGWVTHVAGNRIVGDIPKVDHLFGTDDIMDGLWFVHCRQMEFIAAADHVAIGLPFDAMSFRDDTLAGFRARLLMLREAGYRFPDHVLERVDEEMREKAS